MPGLRGADGEGSDGVERFVSDEHAGRQGGGGVRVRAVCNDDPRDEDHDDHYEREAESMTLFATNRVQVDGYDIRFRNRVDLREDTIQEITAELCRVMRRLAESGKIPAGWEVEAIGPEIANFVAESADVSPEVTNHGEPIPEAVPPSEGEGERPERWRRALPQAGFKYRQADQGPVYVVDRVEARETGAGFPVALMKREDGVGTSLSRVPSDSLRYGDNGWNRVA